MKFHNSLLLAILVLLLSGTPLFGLLSPYSEFTAEAVIDGQPGTNRVLARGPGFEITEQEMFLYLLIVLGDAELLDREATDSDEELKDWIRLRILAKRLAEEAERDAETRRLEPIAERLLASPVARFIYARDIVLPSVVIFPEDIRHFYNSNLGEYQPPTEIELYRLRVPYGDGVTADEARATANDLRQIAIIEGGLAPLIRNNPQYAVDAPGRRFTLSQDTGGLDTQVRNAAFRLGISQISQPLVTQTGVYLLEVVNRVEPERIPLYEVRDEIRQELLKKFINQQVDYLTFEAARKAYPVDRGHLFQFIGDDADIMRVRQFGLQRGDFIRIFPDHVGDIEDPNRELIRAKTVELLLFEVINQELGQKGRLNDPLYARAREIAREIFVASQAIRQLRGQLDPTDEEIFAFLEENREELLSNEVKEVWRFRVFERRDRTRGQGLISINQALIRQYFPTLIAEASRQIQERREVAGEGSLDYVRRVIENLPAPPEASSIRWEFTYLGSVYRNTAKDKVAVEFDNLKLGEFSNAVTLSDGSMAAYFVTEEAQSDDLDEDLIFRVAREAFMRENAEGRISAEIKRMEERGEITFTFTNR